MSEDALAVARRQIESLQDGELQAAQHIGRLYEQREMLIASLTAMLADHAATARCARAVAPAVGLLPKCSDSGRSTDDPIGASGLPSSREEA